MKIKQLFTLALAAGISATSVAETTSGLMITNTATLSFEVNSQPKVAPDATAAFVVDRMVVVNVTTPTRDLVNDTTLVGNNEVITYEISNLSNAALGIKFSINDLNKDAITYPGQPLDNTDTASGPQVTYNMFLDSDGGGTYDVAVDTTPITQGELLGFNQKGDISGPNKDSIFVHVIASAPSQAADADIFAFDLEANAVEVDGTDLIIENDAKWVELEQQTIVAGGSSMFTERGGISISSAVVTLDKTAVITSNPAPFDNLSAENMKAIPGAVVLYSIVVTNKGSAPAAKIAVTDILPFEIKSGDINPNTYKTTITDGSFTEPVVTESSVVIDTKSHLKLTFPEYTIPAGSIDNPETITISFEVTLP